MIEAGTLAVGTDNTDFGFGINLADGTSILAVGGDHSISNPINLNGAVTIAPGPSTLTFNGPVNGGLGSLVLDGNLTLDSSQSNPYKGGTTVNGARLAVGALSQNINPLGSGPLVLNDGSLVTVSTGAVSLSNSITLNGSVTVGGSNSLALAGVIGGTGSLTDGDAASLTLSGNNSYSGGTILTTGNTLVVAGNMAIGAGPLSMNEGSVLTPTGSVSIGNDISVSGSSSVNLVGPGAGLSLTGQLAGLAASHWPVQVSFF